MSSITHVYVSEKWEEAHSLLTLFAPQVCMLCLGSMRSLIALLSFSALVSCGVPDPVDESARELINGEIDGSRPAIGQIIAPSAWCTATLIRPDVILTAAHCVYKDRLASPASVYFCPGGGDGFSDCSKAVGGKTIIIQPNYIHDDYYTVHDISLVALERAVVGVTPIAFARTPPAVGAAVTLVGYGCHTELNAESDQYKRSGASRVEAVEASEIELENDRDDVARICHGDSGGPALQLRGGDEVVVGVHARYGFQWFWELHEPMFTTRVDAYSEWLELHLANIAPPTPVGEPPVIRNANVQIERDSLGLVSGHLLVFELESTAPLASFFITLDGGANTDVAPYVQLGANKMPLETIFDYLIPGTHTVEMWATDVHGAPSVVSRVSFVAEAYGYGGQPPPPPLPLPQPSSPRSAAGCGIAAGVCPVPSLFMLVSCLGLLALRRRRQKTAPLPL